MKKAFIFVITLLALSFAWIDYLSAGGIVRCRCGYGAAGCLPCAEPSQGSSSTPEKGEGEAVVCRCGYGAGGSCLPCAENEGNAPSSKIRRPSSIANCPCGYGAGGSCLPCQGQSQQ